MKILQINTTDYRGGAAQVAFNLYQDFILHGHKSSMLVKDKTTNEKDIFPINHFTHGKISQLSKKVIGKDLPSFIKFKSRDIRRLMIANDIDNFKCDILNLPQYVDADIVQCHNLHGNYFNLHILIEMSKVKPVVWTLHDMWSFTGHCSHSFACERWKLNCGSCPYLNIYPPLFWDNTAKLLKRKKEIYDLSNINFIVPSNWLKEKAEKSIVGKNKLNLIYNGVNTNIFRQYNKNESRKIFGLPNDKKIILFLVSGGAIDKNKGWDFVKLVIDYYKSREDFLFLCIGNKKVSKQTDSARVKYIKYIDDRDYLARYFCVSDLFLFTSLAENFPLVILEAMACGTPIVSFNVGGVKEAIKHREHGYMAKYKDSQDLIKGIEYIFNLSESERQYMGQVSRQRVKENFSLEIMTKNYLKLYQELLDARKNK